MKAWQLYATHIVEATDNETPRLEDFHVLQEFEGVFPYEIPKGTLILISQLKLC